MTFAAVLVFYLMRHHWRCVRNYSAVFSSCEQCQEKLVASGASTSNAGMLRDIDYDSLESGKNGSAWCEEASTGSEYCTGDIDLQVGDGCSHERWGIKSALFYTPATSRAPSRSREYRGAPCGCQTSSGENMEGNKRDAELAKTRIGEGDRARVAGRPAALQRVVVGDIRESMIAKRRLTLGNGVP